ncbi:hypothetical protein Tco_0835253, partial [Tanacetum coccineum]
MENCFELMIILDINWTRLCARAVVAVSCVDCRFGAKDLLKFMVFERALFKGARSDISVLISGDAKIMPSRMRTRSAGRPAAESLGGGTVDRVGRGGRGRRPREGNDERV